MGNKAILMSIKPKWCAKILNGEKTIEVRKKFPKDYVGWVYIYCTKGKPYLKQCEHFRVLSYTEIGNEGYYLNGKVVGRFWCDKVEMIRFEEWILNHNPISHYFTASLNEDDFIKKCGMYNHEEYLDDYLGKKTDNGYAIHISKLEVFDKPKELKELYKVGAWKVFEEQFDSSYLKKEQQEIMEELEQTITKAPQSFQFIEGEND